MLFPKIEPSNVNHCQFSSLSGDTGVSPLLATLQIGGATC